MRLGSRGLPLVTLMFLVGCGALDFLGWETTVSETEHKEKPAKIEDDKIEDKHPVFMEGLETTELFGECKVTMNKSLSVTKLDVLEAEEEDAELKDKLFKSRQEAINWVKANHGMDALMPSLETVNGALKPFNDGLYAAIEMAMQQGIENVWKGKEYFLIRLLDALLQAREGCSGDACYAFEEAAVLVAAGAKLGCAKVEIPSDLKGAVDAEIGAFNNYGIFSRPIGFYTWNSTLGCVFKQDRFLQNVAAEVGDGASFGAFAAMASVIQSNEQLAAEYEEILGLYAVLTNPYANYSVADLYPYVEAGDKLEDLGAISDAFGKDHQGELTCPPKHFALFPSSQSKETTLFNSMFCMQAPPAGTSLIDLFIDKIRSGQVDLEPDADSGWYDYQTYALETLLLPEKGAESDHLLLTKAYKEKLIETFKSIITQNRETHVKQFSIAVMGAAAAPEEIKVKVYPQFKAEPFPTFYLRSARAYRFLSVALEGVLGQDFLNATYRLNEDLSSAESPIYEGLRGMSRLLYGLYLLSCDSLGMKRDLLGEELAEFPEEECITAATQWASTWTMDTDVLKDPRVIVPVARDLEKNAIVYWAVIGVRVLKIRAEFVQDHTPTVISLSSTDEEGYGPTCLFDGFVPKVSYLLVEKMTELSLPDSADPPTRDEFRKACDEFDTEDEIVAALGGIK